MRIVFLISLFFGYTSVCSQIIMDKEQGETPDPVVMEFPGKNQEVLSNKANAWMDNHAFIFKLLPTKCEGLYEKEIDLEKGISLVCNIDIEAKNEKLIVSIKNLSLRESANASNNYKPGIVKISENRTLVDEQLKSILKDLENWVNKN